MGESARKLKDRFKLDKHELEDVLLQIRSQFTPSDLVRKLGIEGLLGHMSVLSDSAILRHQAAGNIVISPYNESNLSTSSYDVTLGDNYFREREPQGKCTILNPYDEKKVRSIWQLCKAKTLHQERTSRDLTLDDIGENISDKDKVIMIRPKSMVLAHTTEYIGGKNIVTTMMKARSTWGRNFIEVCKCAGWGDVGYTNRWTMEITNNSEHYTIPLVVGRRIAQIVFFEVDPILEKDYTGNGKYQKGRHLADLKRTWTPDAMLPKMWLDREVRK